MRQERTLAAVVFLFVLFGCSTGPTYRPPASYPEIPDRVFDASFDEVWVAILETVTDFDIPIDNMEKASGFLRTDLMRFHRGILPSDVIDCGKRRERIWIKSPGAPGGGNFREEWRPVTEYPSFEPEVRLTVLAREIEEKISVRLRTALGGATWNEEGQRITYSCNSTGELERRFFEQIERRLSSR